MLFPTAGIECSPLVPFAAALGISFFTSMAGVSGAFLLLPFQMQALDCTSPSLSATNQLFNVVACPAGVWRYWREGRMLWPLAGVIALGTLPGVFIGALIRIFLLPDPMKFKYFAAAVLCYVGGRMLSRLLGVRRQPARAAAITGACSVRSFTCRELRFAFQGEIYNVSCPKLAALALVVGIVGGAYGIGGGAIMAPFLVSMFGLPIHALAGSTLLATLLTSVSGVVFFCALSPLTPGNAVAPDWALGLLFGLGGIAGMSLGARCQKHVPAGALQWGLVAVLAITILDMLR